MATPMSAPKPCNTRSAAADMVLRFYLTEVHFLGAELSMSAILVPLPADMQALAEHSPDTNEHRQDEPYRRALTESMHVWQPI